MGKIDFDRFLEFWHGMPDIDEHESRLIGLAVEAQGYKFNEHGDIVKQEEDGYTPSQKILLELDQQRRIIADLQKKIDSLQGNVSHLNTKDMKLGPGSCVNKAQDIVKIYNPLEGVV